MIELVSVQNRGTAISVKIINYKRPNTLIPIDLKSRRDSDKCRIFNLDDAGGGPRYVNSKIILYTIHLDRPHNLMKYKKEKTRGSGYCIVAIYVTSVPHILIIEQDCCIVIYFSISDTCWTDYRKKLIACL